MFVNKIRSLKFRHVFIGLAFILTVALILINTRMSSSRLLTVDYRVFGKVQGVFFRKFTKQKANELGLFGWVMNSRDGSVVGTIQGPEERIDIIVTKMDQTRSHQAQICFYCGRDCERKNRSEKCQNAEGQWYHTHCGPNTNKEYFVYILCDKSKVSFDAILETFCHCKSGARTIGTCSHVMAVIWYLSNGRHMTNTVPSTALDNIFYQPVFTSIDSSDESDDEFSSNLQSKRPKH